MLHGKFLKVLSPHLLQLKGPLDGGRISHLAQLGRRFGPKAWRSLARRLDQTLSFILEPFQQLTRVNSTWLSIVDASIFISFVAVIR